MTPIINKCYKSKTSGTVVKVEDIDKNDVTLRCLKYDRIFKMPIKQFEHMLLEENI